MAAQCGCSCAVGSPIDELKSEHRVIERVLDASEKMIADGRIEEPFFRQMIEFVRNFADGCHHAKEEEQLFPAMERAGVPREHGPIGCMLDEHAQGRSYIRAIEGNLVEAANGDQAAARRLRAAVAGYVTLLRLHIQKEDQVLFVMAEHVLDHTVHAELRHAFDRVENSEAAHGKHERYVKLADELCRQARLSTQPL